MNVNIVEYPLLNTLGTQLQQRLGKPFADLRVVISGPHVQDDLPVYLAQYEGLGLDPRLTDLFYKSYPYPRADELLQQIAARGYRLHPIEAVNCVLEHYGNEPLFVIEDGGHVARYSYSHGRLNITGLVEQTTKGLRIHDDEFQLRGNLPFPVLPVAESEIKARLEPPFIADQIVQNIRIFAPALAVRGSRVLIMGAGSIGLALARRLRENGASVRVCDPDPLKRLQVISECGPDAVAPIPSAAASWADLIVGASGTPSLRAEILAAARDKALVASVSSDRLEIDHFWLDQMCGGQRKCFWLGQDTASAAAQTIYSFADGREIVLLSGGYPLNFGGPRSGMVANGADLIMSFMLVASTAFARRVATGSVGCGLLYGEADRVAMEWRLLETYLDVYHAL